jgi:hypothetical protein
VNWLRLVRWALWVILVVGCGACGAHPQAEELGQAYVCFLNVDRDTYLSLDPTGLDQVTTGEYLQKSIDRLEGTRAAVEEGEFEWKYHNGEEYELDRVWVLEYAPPEAVIEVRIDYRIFEQNLETGERRYVDDNLYWRRMTVWLVNEEGVWKVRDQEFISWSG